MAELMKQGIAAFKRGERQEAIGLFREVTVEQPENAQAWLWLAGAVHTDEERATCLQRVLQIDPENTMALKGVGRLVAQGRMVLRSGDGASPSKVQAPPSEASKVAGSSKARIIFKARPSLIPIGILTLMTFLVLGFMIWSTWQIPIGNALGGSIYQWMFTIFIVLGGLSVLGTALKSFIQRVFARYTLTTERLIVQAGVLSRSRKIIPLNRIQDVSFRQSAIERPLGVGDVIVESAGERGGVHLVDLPRCEAYSERLLEAARRAG